MNKLTVVPLSKGNNKEVIEMLRRLLKRAEDGEIQNMVYCADCAGGKVDTGYTALSDRIVTVGMIERLKFQLMADMLVESIPLDLKD